MCNVSRKLTVTLSIKLSHCLALWMLCLNVWAVAPKTVLLVSSNNHFGFVHRLEALIYAQPNVPVKLIHRVVNHSTDIIDKSQLKQADYIVTMGTQALEATLASHTKRPIFSVLIRKHVYHQLLAQYKRALQDPLAPVSALVLDQPPARQFQLIKTLFPADQNISVGLLTHASTLEEKKPLQAVTAPKGITLMTAYMNSTDNSSEALEELLTESRVLLALPDSGLYNEKTARGILLTAYHKRIPVIAYSRTFVNNGALAAVYSTPKQIAHQTSRTIIDLVSQPNGQLPPPLFPDEFSIAVNYQVANSLGIDIPSEGALQKIMLDQEGIIHDA